MWDELGSRSPRQRIIKPPLITRYPPPDEPRISWVRVAGRYLGYDGWSPQQAAVLDRVTGELVYRLPDDTSLGALQADGKVAACHQGRLVWFSPQEPSPHPVPGVRGCHQIIALEDDVVAWRDDDGRFAFRRDHCVITANLASAQENGPRDGGACPVRILSARLTRGGLAIRIRCPDGCRGSVEPRVPVLSRGPSYGRAPALR